MVIIWTDCNNWLWSVYSLVQITGYTEYAVNAGSTIAIKGASDSVSARQYFPTKTSHAAFLLKQWLSEITLWRVTSCVNVSFRHCFVGRETLCCFCLNLYFVSVTIIMPICIYLHIEMLDWTVDQINHAWLIFITTKEINNGMHYEAAAINKRWISIEMPGNAQNRYLIRDKICCVKF